MAGEGRRNLRAAMDKLLDKKQDKPILYPALCGAYVNGQKTLNVSGRSDFIWVRLRGATSEVIQSFNDAVTPHWDLPILVFRDPLFPDIWKVWGRDITQYADWGDVSYLPRHADAHMFAGGNTGADVVWVFKRQFMPLMARPNPTGTMAVYVQSDYYYWNGRYKWWPGSGTADLSSYKPTGGFNAKYITLLLDGDQGLLEILDGTEFNAIYPPDDPSEFIPAPSPDQGIPLVGVKLLTGTFQIGWGELFDIRNIVSALEQTGTVGGLDIYEDSALLGEVDGVSFDAGIDVSISGTIAFAETTAPTIPIYDDSVFRVSATIISFDDNLSVSVSGSVAFIDSTGGGAPTGSNFDIHHDGLQVLQNPTLIDFVDGLDVSVSGSQATIDVDDVDWHSYHHGGTGTTSGGRWYIGKHYHTSIGSHAAYPNDRIYALPLIVPKTRQINGFGITVGFGSATGTVVQAAIYEDDGNIYPDFRVGPYVEFITLSNSTFRQTVTPFYVKGGKLYWIAYASSSGGTQVKRLTGAEFGMGILGQPEGLAGNSPGWAWFATYSASPGVALPTTFPTSGKSMVLSHQTGPIVWVRYHDE
jgi:hypothetical protein